MISIHAPRERSDLNAQNLQIIEFTFQSTLLVRGATEITNLSHDLALISIHAPRERSDKIILPFNLGYVISIHAPRERSDEETPRTIGMKWRFQSTLLVRGATLFIVNRYFNLFHFNPRSS